MKNTENKKAHKFVSICYAVASAGFYITAIMNLAGRNTGSTVVYMCLGSTFLCLSISYQNKSKSYKNEKDKEG